MGAAGRWPRNLHLLVQKRWKTGINFFTGGMIHDFSKRFDLIQIEFDSMRLVCLNQYCFTLALSALMETVVTFHCPLSWLWWAKLYRSHTLIEVHECYHLSTIPMCDSTKIYYIPFSTYHYTV